MLEVAIFAIVNMIPIAEFVYADPHGAPPVFPIFAMPQEAGGWLPTPNLPSDGYLLTMVAPQYQVLQVTVEITDVCEEVSSPMTIHGVGRVRMWTTYYHFRISNPQVDIGGVTVRTAYLPVP